jgi:predicted dehydrogenase
MPIDVDDTTSMLLTFVSGASGYLGTVAATPGFMNLRVFGSKGWAQLLDNNTLVKALVGPPGSNPYATKPETLTFDSQVSLKNQLEAFANAAEGKAPFPIPPADILHGVSAFQSMLDSVRRGSPCSVD